MNSQEKQGYIDEINYQKKMIHNLIKWLRNLFFLSSLGVLLMYYFSNILFVKIFAIILIIISILAIILVGKAIYSGKKNINKIVDQFMITNKINTILNNSQQGDIDYTICNYIKMNLKEVAFMSIEELARKSYVSKAKISKFIKKLGYDNYIAFKDDCLLELEIRKQVTNTNYFLTKKHLHDSLSWIFFKKIFLF